MKFFWEKLTALFKHKSLKSRFTFISSPILFHHIDVGIFRNFRRQKFENFFSLIYITRHDEMSDQQASFCQPVLVKDQIPDLTMHLLKDKNIRLGVSICLDVISIEISISTPKKYQSRRSRKSRRFSKVSLDDREISVEIEISRFSLDELSQGLTF